MLQHPLFPSVLNRDVYRGSKCYHNHTIKAQFIFYMQGESLAAWLWPPFWQTPLVLRITPSFEPQPI